MYLRFVLTVLFLLATLPAHAQQKSLGTFGAWQAFTYQESGQTVCYMVKEAKFAAAKNSKLKRGPAFLMITHRPDENTKDVVSYAAGYNFKAGSTVDMVFGKESFELFTSRDTAWSRDAKTDHALTAAIKSHANVKISAAPDQKGLKNTTDTLDLTGSAQAYQAINRACGYESMPAAKAAPKSAAKPAAKAQKPVKKDKK